MFKEQKEASEPTENFDPEKNRKEAYEEYMRQYAEQEKTGESIWAGKQDQGIHWNLDVPSLEAHMELTDTLNFLYVYDSQTSLERD